MVDNISKQKDRERLRINQAVQQGGRVGEVNSVFKLICTYIPLPTLCGGDGGGNVFVANWKRAFSNGEECKIFVRLFVCSMR